MKTWPDLFRMILDVKFEAQAKLGSDSIAFFQSSLLLSHRCSTLYQFDGFGKAPSQHKLLCFFLRHFTDAFADFPAWRYLSTPAAILRPSAMAQTMSEAPRLVSPPEKTPSRLVMKCSSVATAPR